MNEATCLLCQGGTFRRVIRAKSPHVLLHNFGGKLGDSVQFVACVRCGLVCQFPMLTEEQCGDLYTGTYRDNDLNEARLDYEQSLAEVVVEWMSRHLGPSGRGRRALDVGCGSGTFLLPLRERGWEVCGIEPLEAWAAVARERFGLAVTTGFYDRQSYPESRFDLIVMSHVIEHLPDPRPILAAVTSHLAPGGCLFIGTPNVVLPKLTPSIGSFNAAHVRLYSLNTLSRLLAGSGFKTSASINLWPKYGLAVLAEPFMGAAPAIAADDADDANAVIDLYNGLLQRKHGIYPEGATPLSRNLAVLHPGRPGLVQLLCRQFAFQPFRLIQQPGRAAPDLVEDRAEGVRLLIADPDEPGIAASVRAASARASIVVTGRGWWDAAAPALAQLRDEQRLLIREPDLRRFKLALMARDLSHLLGSPRVDLEVGPASLRKQGPQPAPADDGETVIRDGQASPVRLAPVLSGGS